MIRIILAAIVLLVLMALAGVETGIGMLDQLIDFVPVDLLRGLVKV